jgi:hypothetical protein
VPVSTYNGLDLRWCPACETTWNVEYLRGFWAGFGTLATLPMRRAAMARLTAPAAEKETLRLNRLAHMASRATGGKQ